MTRVRTLLPVLSLTLTACAVFQGTPLLKPAEQPHPLKPHAELAGVKLWAGTSLWRGAPSDTEATVSIVGVDIDNVADHDIRFSLADVRLVDDQARRTAPLFIMNPARTPSDTLESNTRLPQNTGDTEAALKLIATGEKPSSVFVLDNRRSGPAQNAWRDEQGVVQVTDTWAETVRPIRAPNDFRYRALYDRDIAPGERAHGLIVFPRVAGDARQVWLEWTPRVSKTGALAAAKGNPTIRVPFNVVAKGW